MAKRPIAFKVRVLELYEHHGKNPFEAFAQACEEFNLKPSGCMTKYASGYIRDYEFEVKAKLWDHDPQIHAMCNRAKLYGADGMTVRGFHQHMSHLKDMTR